MLLKELAKLHFSTPVYTKTRTTNKWITAACLFENNATKLIEQEDTFNIDSCIQVEQNDILIKRISPTYVNVYESTQKALIGTNIIIIRANNNPYYIAYILSQNLKKLNALANNGTRFNSINRSLLESIEIPDLSMENEDIIGELWRLSNAKQALLEQLKSKEKLKQETIEKKILFIIGDKSNGRD